MTAGAASLSGSLQVISGAGDKHLHTEARYVERNAQRANLARRAAPWRWGSLYRWLRGSAEDGRLLSAWPVPRQPGWVEHVNEPLTEAGLMAVRRSLERGRPYGSETWCNRAIDRLDLHSTIRPRGRPKKTVPDTLCSPPPYVHPASVLYALGMDQTKLTYRDAAATSG